MTDDCSHEFEVIADLRAQVEHHLDREVKWLTFQALWVKERNQLEARAQRLEEALLAVLPIFEEFCGESYGLFPGGDPRDFKPDPEVCTPEEIENHRLACIEWNEGRGVDRGPSCFMNGDGSAWTGTGFGTGTYTYLSRETALVRAALAGQEEQE